jgi:hypothetical protein
MNGLRYQKPRARALGIWLLALLCDFSDRWIAMLTGMVSGHMLKHLLAALSAYWVVLRLKHRRIL